MTSQLVNAGGGDGVGRVHGIGGPKLSIVVVIYDMEREARRSLHSLSPTYQRGVSADEYEVIVVDNGSPRPFNRGSVAEFGPNVTYHYLPDANQSKQTSTYGVMSMNG